MANIKRLGHLLRRLAFLALCFFAASLLPACATTSSPPPNTPRPASQQGSDRAAQNPVKPPEASEVKQDKAPSETAPPFESRPEATAQNSSKRDGLTPPYMKGRDIKRLALLLPFSTTSPRLREEADSMLKAAQLAVFERDEADVLLIVLDTAGTPKGASSAARAAGKAGADVILGPVLSKSVASAKTQARRSNIPLIAFSTDQSIAGNGTYLLSFPPEAEVRRIVNYAASTGAVNYAYLGPDGAYGKRVLVEYQNSVRDNGGKITVSKGYKGKDISVMQEPARQMANAYHANEDRVGPEGRRLFEAVMLPEGDIELRSLAPLLPFYDIDPSKVQFMGTSRWHREDVVREPALEGGVFAGPDKNAQAAFQAGYDRQYAQDPSRLASLAFDAVNIGAVIADGPPQSRRLRAEDPSGFYGADGLVSWGPSGRPDRGLAVYQIQGGRFVIIEPAPTRTGGPS